MFLAMCPDDRNGIALLVSIFVGFSITAILLRGSPENESIKLTMGKVVSISAILLVTLRIFLSLAS